MSTATLPAKINLPTKGATAQLNSVQQLKATMKWNTAADYDLAAIVVKKDKSAGLVFFNAKGDKNAFPFIRLDKDAGVGDKVDTGGENSETLVIAKIDDSVEEIHLIAWDFGAAQKGQAARFTNALKMGITSVGANATDNVEAALEPSGTPAGANGVIAATIRRTALGEMEFVNTSKEFILTATDAVSILTAAGIAGSFTEFPVTNA